MKAETIVVDSATLQISESLSDSSSAVLSLKIFSITPVIVLNKERVSKLYKWLGSFLNEHSEEQPCKLEDVGMEPPLAIKCPCGCRDGIMLSDGRNALNNLTFLVCSVCGCCYHAIDKA